jgi:undecaprenyl-diphosphatase
VSQIVDGLINLPPWLVLLVAFLLPAAEASVFVGVVFPGEIAIVIAGVLAHAHKLPLWAVIVVGTAGAVIGDSIGYEVGARYGDRLLAKLPKRLVKPEHVDQGRALLRRRGGWAVLIGRFTAALRALVPGLAGTSRLPYRTFLPFNFVGGLAWVTMSALIGYVAGASYKAAEHRLSLISGGLLALVALAVVYRIIRGSDRAQAWIERHGDKLPGRRLTAFAVVTAVAGVLLGGLASEVATAGAAPRYDQRLLRDAIDHRSGWLTGLARVVTTLGTWPVVYAVVAALAALTIWRARPGLGSRWLLPVGALVWLAAGQAVRLAVSHGIARARPPEAFWLAHPSGLSFPSGHTTLATVGYGLAAVLAARLLRRGRAVTAALTAGAVLLAVAVGASRVYLGVHWPSDVAGGWALGVGWLALAATAVSIHQRRAARTPPAAAPSGTQEDVEPATVGGPPAGGPSSTGTAP